MRIPRGAARVSNNRSRLTALARSASAAIARQCFANSTCVRSTLFCRVHAVAKGVSSGDGCEALGVATAWYHERQILVEARAPIASGERLRTAALHKEDQALLSELKSEPFRDNGIGDIGVVFGKESARHGR